MKLYKNKTSVLVVWAVLFYCFPVLAVKLNGVVVNGEDSRVPVVNALVSVGHSSVKTTTDSEGKFSLEVSELAAGTLINSVGMMRIRFLGNQRLFDFSQAEAVERFSIFRLDGSVVFRADLGAGKRIVRIPAISKGLYLVRFTSGQRQITKTWIMSGSNSTFECIMPEAIARRSAAVGNVKLLLRHDEYYPLDFETYGTTEGLLIGMRPDPRAYVFDPMQVHSYYFTLSKEDSLKMEREARRENYVRAEMQFNGKSYGTVGFRYKGSFYSLPNCFDLQGNREDKPVCKKISFKVKFNKFVDTTRFYLMKELNLHSMSADDSKMHDMLSYEMFRKMGIYSPRTAYVKVYINNVFQGLFVAVESIDGRFTKSRWPEYGDGNLYKEAWPKTSNINHYLLQLKTNNDYGETPDATGMVSFYNAINSSTQQNFVQNVSPFIDLDYWVNYIVVDRAINNWDGIMAWYGSSTSDASNHNYFLYEEENPGGKCWIIPWDLDNTFWKNDPFIEDADIPNWNEVPESCGPMKVWGTTNVIPPGCDKLTSLIAATQWNKFVKAGEDFLATWFRSDSLQDKIDKYQQVISDVVEIDPVVEKKTWEAEVESLRKDVVTLCKKFDDYIHGRKEVMDTSDYSVPFVGNGYLVTDRTNNFEFTPVSTVKFAYAYASEGTITKLTHNTENPLWGTADLLFNFEYAKIEDNERYSEWSGMGVLFDEMADLSELKEIRVNMKSDAMRYMRVYLASPVYADSGADTEYGWTDFYLGTSNKIYVFKMSDISYPSWGNPSNPDILEEVKKSVTGLVFTPSAMFDAAGELSVVPDKGYLAIDNIKFVFE